MNVACYRHTETLEIMIIVSLCLSNYITSFTKRSEYFSEYNWRTVSSTILLNFNYFVYIPSSGWKYWDVKLYCTWLVERRDDVLVSENAVHVQNKVFFKYNFTIMFSRGRIMFIIRQLNTFKQLQISILNSSPGYNEAWNALDKWSVQ